MFKELIRHTAKPALYEMGTANFWDDPHMSKLLLEAHLNPNWDAASRKPATIDKTVQWITANFLESNSAILDLGCGPGLYAERLAQLGHKVTGLDFSRRSIDYAKQSAELKGLAIEYHYQNYLTMDYSEQFDLIILIYCDLGALIKQDREVLMHKMHAALKPGGVLIFDVFTDGFKNAIQEKQRWQLTDNGFWAAGPHCALTQTFHYPEDKVVLNQTIVVREDGSSDVYRIYDNYFSEEDLASIVASAGFTRPVFSRDILESTDFESAQVVFVAMQKP